MNIYPFRKLTSKLLDSTGKSLLWLFVLLFNSVIASELQSHDEIHRAVKKFAGDVAIQEVDPRLRLKNCDAILEVRHPFSTKTTVEVSCPAEDGWKLFLTVSPEYLMPEYSEDPVNSSTEISKGIIAKRRLQRGIKILASDVESKAFPSNRLKMGHFSNIDGVIGMEPNQTIPKGALISSNMLRPPILVRKGDAVSIVFERNGLSVINEGIALENGGLREKIKIQLPDTKKILSATIQSPGVVKIP
jgi:flagella basal body P-ring formation protein FlgA